MKNRETKLVLVLFLSFILVFVPQIQSATSSEPKTTKTGNITQLWKFPVVGVICNRPVVKDGFVYVTSSYHGASIGYVYCLNDSTGAIVWNYTTIDYIYGPLYVAEGITYKDTGRALHPNTLYIINATTGEEMWNLPETRGTPTIADGYLCLGNTCFNATTGTKIWEFSTEDPTNQSFVPSNYVLGTPYFIMGSENTLYCLDMKTGKQIWNYSDPEFFRLCCGVVDDRVFLRQTYETDQDNVVSNVIVLDVFTGKKIWNYRFQDAIGRVEISKELVYIRTDTVYCIDVITGLKEWAYKQETTRLKTLWLQTPQFM